MLRHFWGEIGAPRDLGRSGVFSTPRVAHDSDSSRATSYSMKPVAGGLGVRVTKSAMPAAGLKPGANNHDSGRLQVDSEVRVRASESRLVTEPDGHLKHGESSVTSRRRVTMIT